MVFYGFETLCPTWILHFWSNRDFWVLLQNYSVSHCEFSSFGQMANLGGFINFFLDSQPEFCTSVKWLILGAVSKLFGFPFLILPFWSNGDFWVLFQKYPDSQPEFYNLGQMAFLSAISKISGFPTSNLVFWSNEDFWLLSLTIHFIILKFTSSESKSRCLVKRRGIGFSVLVP
jgi:hypothetical protein